MALPLWMIKDLKIDRTQKIGLGLIFSVALFCVALDIVRTIEAVAQHQALYTIIEINLVVIISCLPVYRSLLNKFQRHRSTRPKGSSAWRSLEDGAVGKAEGRDSHLLRNMNTSESNSGANVIHITKDIAVSNMERDPYLLEPLEGHSRPQAASSYQTLGFS